MKKGISLIILVITIIVIIIIAGSVILSLTQNSPINKANEAKFKESVSAYNGAVVLENARRYAAASPVGSYDTATFDLSTWTSGTTTGTIKELIPSMSDADAAKFSVQDGKLVYLGSNTDEQTWLIAIGISTGATPYNKSNPAGTEASPNAPLAVDSTIDGQLPSATNPVIPGGFSPVNTAGADWSNTVTGSTGGLVVQDSGANQFIWVPVDGSTLTFAKWGTNGVLYSLEVDDTFPQGLNETTQVNKYGGFYVGRYETAFDYNGGNIRAIVKKSTNKFVTAWNTTRDATKQGYLWNFINYADAKYYAENFATANGLNTNIFVSNLMTGTQFDTILKWIQNSGKNVGDSIAWGNHSDSVSPAAIMGYGTIQVSGFSDYWKARNIYDIAGNLWEWTNGSYSGNNMNRGGNCFASGTMFGASYRGTAPATTCNEKGTFRICLVIK